MATSCGMREDLGDTANLPKSGALMMSAAKFEMQDIKARRKTQEKSEPCGATSFNVPRAILPCDLLRVQIRKPNAANGIRTALTVNR